MKIRNVFCGVLLSFAWVSMASAGEALSREMATQKVEVRNIQLQGNVISGEVVNKSQNPMRNLELLIQYHWLWNNEFKPGATSPGKSLYVVLDKELRPGEPARFSAPLDPLAAPRHDGYYMTEVTLAGFTEIIPPRAG
jgi:hypothetical protein